MKVCLQTKFCLVRLCYYERQLILQHNSLSFLRRNTKVKHDKSEYLMSDIRSAFVIVNVRLIAYGLHDATANVNKLVENEDNISKEYLRKLAEHKHVRKLK